MHGEMSTKEDRRDALQRGRKRDEEEEGETGPAWPLGSID